MELFGENDFKVRSYNSAVFNLEKSDTALSTLSQTELEKIDGVGKSIAKAIAEINETGQLSVLEDMLSKTPDGVLEMLDIKGVGPKKIKVLWEELKVESLEALLEACKQDKVSKLKGFGAKTQDKIIQMVQFKMQNRGWLHYSKAEAIAKSLLESLKQAFPKIQSSLCGSIRRKMEVTNTVEIIVGTDDFEAIETFIKKADHLELDEKKSGPFTLRATETNAFCQVVIYLCKPENFYNELFSKTANPQHLGILLKDEKTLYTVLKEQKFDSEEAIYKSVDLPYIAPELREGFKEFEWASEQKLPKLVEMEDLKGILHNHSTYSDGQHSLEKMATYCKELGYEYLGITDHSKTAVYANGLYENRIKDQHEEIEALNSRLGPFKIFKGIESDILNDGALDYADDVLASFDFIVASIHSGLQMDEKAATERLIKAVSNPFTTMLGHPTGRLLLQREGYPINHKAVIDACAEYGVIIEINANPWRLDLDWRYVSYALEKGVMISINPDAHAMNGYHDMYYGVCVGRKGGLTAEMTFNAKSAKEVASHFEKRKEKALAAVK